MAAWLVLSKADLKELTAMLRHNEQPVWRASDELRHAFQRIARAVETESPRGEHFAADAATERVVPARLGHVPPQRRPLGRLVVEQLPQRQLFLDDLAANPSTWPRSGPCRGWPSNAAWA